MEYASYSIEIYSSLGQLVYKKDIGKIIGTFNDKIDVVNFSNGLYIINVISDKNTISTKFIKQ